MNAGVNATGLVNHAEIFLRAVPADSVDVLVWLFPWLDVRRSYATVSYLWPPVAKPRFALVEVVDHLVHRFWIRFLRETRTSAGDGVDADADRTDASDRGLARQARNLEAARAVAAEARRRQVPVVIGVTPLRRGDVLAPLSEEAIAFLREAEASGAHVFDATAALGGVGADVSRHYYDHVHFSETGHRAIGVALGARLSEIVR
jgi:hypothetical protein